MSYEKQSIEEERTVKKYNEKLTLELKEIIKTHEIEMD